MARHLGRRDDRQSEWLETLGQGAGALGEVDDGKARPVRDGAQGGDGARIAAAAAPAGGETAAVGQKQDLRGVSLVLEVAGRERVAFAGRVVVFVLGLQRVQRVGDLAVAGADGADAGAGDRVAQLGGVAGDGRVVGRVVDPEPDRAGVPRAGEAQRGAAELAGGGVDGGADVEAAGVFVGFELADAVDGGLGVVARQPARAARYGPGR